VESRTSEISIPFRISVINFFIKNLLRLGVPVGPTTLLTVRGRKTSIQRTTPVEFLEHDGRFYVLGWFGNTNWCKNLRAVQEASVGRGIKRKKVIAEEVRDMEKWTRVLKEIIAPFLGSGILKMGFELTKDSTMEDYAREARRHPGFEVRFKDKSD
jgi:deazaflavin-dependent oxidoreductase (nitroreductase family)